MNLKPIVIGLAVLGLAATAQEKKIVREHVTVFDGVGGGAAGAGQTIRFMQFDAGPVKGAPYAAEAMNETIQTLSDGNRIVEKHSSRMYRDAEGRTRMENNFGPLGPLVPEGKAPSITSINDPVSGEHFMLDNNRKTATKMMMPKITLDGKPGEQREVRVEMRHTGPAGSSATATATVDHDVMIAGPAVMREGVHLNVMEAGAARPDVKKELLGKQTIEGVECDGTRETVTIPAGAMGNERPLVSVTERWVSAKLGLDVLRKHTDPRFGETNYRLTKIVQADQPRNLFEVPADYKVEEGGAGNVIFNRKIKEAKE
ncbi:MAG TPA: hypothetical protein VGK29_17480 [Paludibaculum sp.]|jgi:hypothetical protein